VALSPQDLIERGELSVTLSLAPERLWVGQEATFTIEIATPRWFGGGTRIKTPSSEDLLLIQRQAFAANSTERRQGQTWVRQRWSLSLFPRRAGELTVPAITLSVAINTSDEGLVQGEIITDPFRFNAHLPAPLVGRSGWLASPMASIKFRSDKSLQNLAIGDAFKITYTLEAQDLMAMMLPPISLPAIPGLGIYPAIPQLKDNSNRGLNSASRSSEFSVVVEAAGQYTIPAQSIEWWNTAEEKLDLLTTEALVITVAAAGQMQKEQAVLAPLWVQPWHHYTALFSTLLLIVLLLLRDTNSIERSAKNVSVSALRKQFAEAIATGQWHSAVAIIYRWLDSRREISLPMLLHEAQQRGSQQSQALSEELEQLFAAAYSQQAVAGNNGSGMQFVALLGWVGTETGDIAKVRRWFRPANKSPLLSLNPID